MRRILEAKEDRLKFIDWIKNEVDKNFIVHDDLDTWSEKVADKFISFKPRLKSPYNDFYYWMKNSNFDEFYDYLRSLEAKVYQDASAKKKEQDGARLVYSDDNWKVYEITTYEASAKYGKGTKWCITGTKRWNNTEEGGRDHFDRYYSQSGVKFYFFIKNGTEKYALAVYPEGSCEIFNAEDVGIPYIPDAPVVDEIKADYKNESNSNILVNAIMNKKLPNDVLMRIIQETFNDNTGFDCTIYTKNDVNDLISEVDNMIPDGYLEATDNGEDWDGDLPSLAWGEIESLSGVTKEEKLKSLEYTLKNEADYIVLEESYDGWLIDPLKDYTELFMWANNRCGIEDWTDGELDDFFINSLDADALEHVHPGRLYVFPIMLANRLIWDIKEGNISSSVLNGLGLTDDYMKHFGEDLDKIYFENEKITEDVSSDYYYHGSSDAGIEVLNRPINWITKDYEYAKFFALATNDSGYVYKCKPTLGNLFDVGDTTARVYDLYPLKPYRLSREFTNIVRRLNLSEDKVNRLLENVIAEYELPNDGYKMKIDLVTRSVAFQRILEGLGYDGIHAIEYNEKANTKHDTYGLFNSIKVLGCEEVHLNENLNEKDYNRPTKMFDFDKDEATWDKDAEDYIWWGSESDKWAENYAKSYKVKMSPKDYLDLTTDKGANAYNLGDYIGGGELRQLDKDELNKETYQPIFLQIAFRDANRPTFAQVVGHEGRHRMFALWKAGYNKVDVELRCEVWDTNFEKAKPFELTSIDLQGQFNKYVWVTVWNPIPMSWKNHKAIRPNLKDEDLNEYLDTIESSSQVYSDYPIMLTDEPYKLKNILENSDVPYRIFKLNDVYYFQNAMGNKTHYDMMHYAIQKGYANEEEFDDYDDEAFMVFIPSGFDGDMRYFTSLGEDSYYCVSVYPYGRIYVRDSYALKNSLFNALGKPERVVYYDYDDDICTIVKDNKEVDISVEYDLDGEPDNAITFDIYSIFSLDDIARPVVEDYLTEKIVKKGNKWQVQSEKGRNLGTYDTKEEAEKRLKQVEYFKHVNEDYKDDLYLSEDDFEEFNVGPRSYPSYDEYDENNMFYGIMLNDENVGNLAFRYDYEKDSLYLDGIEIKSQYRNRGIGRRAIELLKNEFPKAKEIKLNAIPSSVEFYKKLGFKVTKDTNMKLKIKESLKEDYKDDFISRTTQHIARVNKYAKKINKSYPNHDSDKFNELFDGYSLMNKKDVSEEEQKMIDDATYKHVINNEHHPEHWCNPKDVEGFSGKNPNPHGCLDCSKMSESAMEEMCCDWCAMSEEFNNTPFEWFDKVKDTRWHFNEEQEKFILDTLHKLWDRE